MSNESQQEQRPFIIRWILASFLGWLLGLIITIVLAVSLEAISGGGAQFMVGLGIGAGVGYMQGRVLKDKLANMLAWVWASTIGMGLPFILWDISSLAGSGLPFSMPLCVAIGSLIVGILQWRLLQPLSPKAWWWIPGCFLGWTLTAGLTDLLAIIIIFFGGAVMGAISGAVLVRIVEGKQSETV